MIFQKRPFIASESGTTSLAQVQDHSAEIVNAGGQRRRAGDIWLSLRSVSVIDPKAEFSRWPG